MKNDRGESHSYEDMTEWAVSQVLRSFGKGEDLKGACALIVSQSSYWGMENYKANKEKVEKANRRKKKKSVA